jgi:hypothetical protein
MKIPLLSLGKFAGRGLIWYVKLGFIGLFLTYLLISAIVIGIQSKDLGITIKELGEQFYNPLGEAQKTALDIIDAGGIRSESIFTLIFDYLGFFFNLYIIYWWFYIIYRIMYLFLGGTNTPLTVWMFVIFIFFAVQVGYFISLGDGDWNTPFVAVWDIIRSMQYLFNPEIFGDNKYSLFGLDYNINNSVNEKCIDGVCQI